MGGAGGNVIALVRSLDSAGVSVTLITRKKVENSFGRHTLKPTIQLENLHQTSLQNTNTESSKQSLYTNRDVYDYIPQRIAPNDQTKTLGNNPTITINRSPFPAERSSLFRDSNSIDLNSSCRVSKGVDAFVGSLRKYTPYPNLIQSASLIDKVIRYTRNKHKFKPRVSKSSRKLRLCEKSTQCYDLPKNQKQSKQIQTYTRMKVKDSKRNSRSSRNSGYYGMYDYLKVGSFTRPEREQVQRINKMAQQFYKEVYQSTCPYMKYRYDKHKTQCPANTNREMDRAKLETPGAVSKFLSSFGSCSMPEVKPSKSCGCSDSDISNLAETSTMTESLTKKLCKLTKPRNGTKKCCVCCPKPCFSKVNDFDDDDSCLCANLKIKTSHCDCSKNISEEYYKTKVDEAIQQWLTEIPIHINEKQCDKMRRNSMLCKLAESLKAIPYDDNFNKNVGNEIEKVIDILPMWKSTNKADQVLLKEQLFKSLYDKITDISRDPHNLKHMIKKWISNLKFTEYIDRKDLADHIYHALKTIVENKPDDEKEFKELLDQKVIEILDELPLHIEHYKDTFHQRLANNLARDIIDSPYIDLKADHEDKEKEFKYILRHWLEELNSVRPLSEVEEDKLVRNLVPILNKMLQPSQKLNPAVEAKLKSDIRKELSALDVDSDIQQNLIEDLADTVNDADYSQGQGFSQSAPKSWDDKMKKNIHDILDKNRIGSQLKKKINEVIDLTINKHLDAPIDDTVKESMLTDIYKHIDQTKASPEQKAYVKDTIAETVENIFTEPATYRDAQKRQKQIEQNVNSIIDYANIPEEEKGKAKYNIKFAVAKNLTKPLVDDVVSDFKNNELVQNLGKDVTNEITKIIAKRLEKFPTEKTELDNLQDDIFRNVGHEIDRTVTPGVNKDALKSRLMDTMVKHINGNEPMSPETLNNLRDDIQAAIDESPLKEQTKANLKMNIDKTLSTLQDNLQATETSQPRNQDKDIGLLKSRITTDTDKIIDATSLSQPEKEELKKRINDVVGAINPAAVEFKDVNEDMYGILNNSLPDNENNAELAQNLATAILNHIKEFNTIDETSKYGGRTPVRGGNIEYGKTRGPDDEENGYFDDPNSPQAKRTFKSGPGGIDYYQGEDEVSSMRGSARPAKGTGTDNYETQRDQSSKDIDKNRQKGTNYSQGEDDTRSMTASVRQNTRSGRGRSTDNYANQRDQSSINMDQNRQKGTNNYSGGEDGARSMRGSARQSTRPGRGSSTDNYENQRDQLSINMEVNRQKGTNYSEGGDDVRSMRGSARQDTRPGRGGSQMSSSERAAREDQEPDDMKRRKMGLPTATSTPRNIKQERTSSVEATDLSSIASRGYDKSYRGRDGSRESPSMTSKSKLRSIKEGSQQRTENYKSEKSRQASGKKQVGSGKGGKYDDEDELSPSEEQEGSPKGRGGRGRKDTDYGGRTSARDGQKMKKRSGRVDEESDEEFTVRGGQKKKKRSGRVDDESDEEFTVRGGQKMKKRSGKVDDESDEEFTVRGGQKMKKRSGRVGDESDEDFTVRGGQKKKKGSGRVDDESDEEFLEGSRIKISPKGRKGKGRASKTRGEDWSSDDEDRSSELEESGSQTESRFGRAMEKDGIYDIIEKDVENLQFDDESLDEEDEDNMRQQIKARLINKVAEMSMDPEIFNDDFLYEDMMRDEIDTIFGDYPITEKSAQAVKEELVEKTKEAKAKARSGLAGKIYKQQLRDAISNTLPPKENETLDEKALYEELKDELADAFINLNYTGGNDAQKEKLKNKVKNIINKFCADYLKTSPSEPLNTDKLQNDLYAALKAVPMPADDTIRPEIRQARIRDEINNWLSKLPLRDLSHKETLNRIKIINALAKKMDEIEQNEAIENKDQIMRQEIQKFLKKNILRPNKEKHMEMFIDDLIELLNDTMESRKFDTTLKYPVDLEEPVCPFYNSLSGYNFDLPCPETCKKPVIITPSPCTLSPEDQALLNRIRARCVTSKCNISVDAPCQKELRATPKVCPFAKKPSPLVCTKSCETDVIRRRTVYSSPAPCGAPRISPETQCPIAWEAPKVEPCMTGKPYCWETPDCPRRKPHGAFPRRRTQNPARFYRPHSCKKPEHIPCPGIKTNVCPSIRPKTCPSLKPNICPGMKPNVSTNIRSNECPGRRVGPCIPPPPAPCSPPPCAFRPSQQSTPLCQLQPASNRDEKSTSSYCDSSSKACLTDSNISEENNETMDDKNDKYIGKVYRCECEEEDDPDEAKDQPFKSNFNISRCTKCFGIKCPFPSYLFFRK